MTQSGKRVTSRLLVKIPVNMLDMYKVILVTYLNMLEISMLGLVTFICHLH